MASDERLRHAQASSKSADIETAAGAPPLNGAISTFPKERSGGGKPRWSWPEAQKSEGRKKFGMDIIKKYYEQIGAGGRLEDESVVM
jgi:hypothetical protein